jgi:polar amino acid transport system substrate-binding protein
VGSQIDPGPYGIGVRKDDTELQQVLQEALRAIIEDGSYDRVLSRSGTSPTAPSRRPS